MLLIGSMQVRITAWVDRLPLPPLTKSWGWSWLPETVFLEHRASYHLNPGSLIFGPSYEKGCPWTSLGAPPPDPCTHHGCSLTLPGKLWIWVKVYRINQVIPNKPGHPTSAILHPGGWIDVLLLVAKMHWGSSHVIILKISGIIYLNLPM